VGRDEELGALGGPAEALDEAVEDVRVEAGVDLLDAGERRRTFVVQEGEESERADGPMRSLPQTGVTAQALFLDEDVDDPHLAAEVQETHALVAGDHGPSVVLEGREPILVPRYSMEGVGEAVGERHARPCYLEIEDPERGEQPGDGPHLLAATRR